MEITVGIAAACESFRVAVLLHKGEVKQMQNYVYFIVAVR